jgi:light-regulated signal transduction histidine kinase (bacteriophytochrome)
LQTRSVTFDTDELIAVNCDSVLMRHVWSNLISNAIKYSSKVENPMIAIKSTENEHDVIYSVKDNGVGFDMKYSHKLFGVFQRLHNKTDFDGTGVGLALVQRIVAKHGGKVWAEGVENTGATFYFSIPKTIVHEQQQY